ncbi:PREDICTED: glucose-6-phosphatase 3 [Gekko japonicus]|uniref:Glucose-6-phosphatase n=1 Tax=Gekko japonicus TaxID=146911 RepID=A0ABM1KY71_GEKJA|nr:PREDICTED: glucose-6-phosphatase 3 [Gekko japonicus]
MDAFYSNGIWIAELLQGVPCMEDFWLWVTFLGDPKCVFIIYFPIAYFLDWKVGLKVLWLGLISEWLNLVFKWFLFGERPFWWVLESAYSSKTEVSLQQFPASCETGPGSPSGHCMITGAALWPLVTTLSVWSSQHAKSRIIRAVPFTVYLLLLLAVGLSRIFILAHFPHQVLGGILAGIILGWLLESRAPLERELSFYLRASLFLLLSTLTTYWTLIALGVDLNWSLGLATKWCANPKWIRIDTRPFASLTRDVATALGLGLALHSSYYSHLKWEKLSWPQRVWCASLATLVLKVLSNAAQPENLALWYGLTFVKYATFPWVVVALLPRLVHAVASRKASPHQK